MLNLLRNVTSSNPGKRTTAPARVPGLLAYGEQSDHGERTSAPVSNTVACQGAPVYYNRYYNRYNHGEGSRGAIGGDGNAKTPRKSGFPTVLIF